jgi:hypothetical protein
MHPAYPTRWIIFMSGGDEKLSLIFSVCSFAPSFFCLTRYCCAHPWKIPEVSWNPEYHLSSGYSLLVVDNRKESYVILLWVTIILQWIFPIMLTISTAFMNSSYYFEFETQVTKTCFNSTAHILAGKLLSLSKFHSGIYDSRNFPWAIKLRSVRRYKVKHWSEVIVERERGLPRRLLPYLQARTSPTYKVIGKGVRIVSVLPLCVVCDHYLRV